MSKVVLAADCERGYTLEESLGMRELRPEVARFTYANDIETLGRYCFNRDGIERAFRQLIIINRVEHPELFMTEKGNEACPWQPSQFDADYRRDVKVDEEFENRLEDAIRVCFWDFSGGMINPNRDKEPWHKLMQERFLPLVKKAVSGPVRYDYGTGEHSNITITEFRKERGGNKTWQMWIPFFENALTADSCFVHGSIGIRSWNYEGHPSYERYGHTRFGMWNGKFKEFVRRAEIIEKAFKKLMPYDPKESPKGASGEVKLFHKDLGMICMRSEGKQYEAYHPKYILAQRRLINAPRTMIFGKYAFEKLVADFSR